MENSKKQRSIPQRSGTALDAGIELLLLRDQARGSVISLCRVSFIWGCTV